MARQISQFGRFESLETRKMMTGEMGIEMGTGTEQAVQTASISSQADYGRAESEDPTTTSGPSAAEIKKHSSKPLKIGSKGDAI